MARPSFNSFIVQGNLGKDAEVKTVGNNMQMVAFSIAANLCRNGPNSQDFTVWFNCSMFRNVKLAEHLKKGTKVIVNGRLEMATGNDGKVYYGILVNDIELLGSSQSNQGGSANAAPAQNSGSNNNGGFSGNGGFGDDPFGGI